MPLPEPRRCAVCDDLMPAHKRAHARYCGQRCKSAQAWRTRAAVLAAGRAALA